MQTTLLGLAIALILALLAALVGPYFVNWNDYRSTFEAEASRMVGLEVRVAGDIEVRALPFPSVKLADIEVGPAGHASRLRARSLGIEFGLGPMMRGELRAVEMRLVEPQISLGLNSLGQVDWPTVMLADEGLSIDRLRIEDGRVLLADLASDSRLTIEKLNFTGEVRSLIGPFNGNGTFTAAGSSYTYRIGAGRFGPDGIKVKLALDDPARPLNAEFSGMLAFQSSAPQINGSLKMWRPAGVVRPDGRVLAQEPWRLVGQISGTSQVALVEQLSFQYGPDERVVSLDGTAAFKFGAKPALQAALSARQIDLDRLVATPAAPRRPPLAAIQSFAELFSAAIRPPLPTTLALSVDAVTLGGALVQNVGADLGSDRDGWRIEKLEFRAPGFSQVRLSGALQRDQAGLRFAGTTNVNANDPRALVAWLTGRGSVPSQIKPLRLSGEFAIGADRIAVERLQATFDRGRIDGRLAYLWPDTSRPARVEAELTAGELDLDAMLQFGKSALDGLDLQWPGEGVLALDIGRARLTGFEARNIQARLSFDRNGIAIEKLAVADFGNAAIAASGRIVTSAQPGGNIAVDLDARDLSGVIAVTSKFAPSFASALEKIAGQQNAAKLHVAVGLDNVAQGEAKGTLAVAGRIGQFRIDLGGNATGKPSDFSWSNFDITAMRDATINASLEADDAGALLALIGLDRISGAATRPGRLAVSATGPLGTETPVEIRLSAEPIDAKATGRFRTPDGEPMALTLDKLSGRIGTTTLRGALTVTIGDSPQIEGALETVNVDGPIVIAAALGAAPQRNAPSTAWSSEPFRISTSNLSGHIAVKAERLSLSPTLTARDVSAVLRFAPAQVTLDDIAGELAGGRLGGHLLIATDRAGVTAQTHVALTGIDAAAIAHRAALGGKLSIEADLKAGGLSPAAFVGSMAGSGRVTLDEARLTGLNPNLFGAVMRAVDLGIPTDTVRIRDFVASSLDNGVLPIKRAEAAITVTDGRAQLGDVALHDGLDVEIKAGVNLADVSLDAVMTMAGAAVDGSAIRPTVFVMLKGPLFSPRRSVEADALASWLTLRAIEQQSERLNAMARPAEPTEPLATSSVPPVEATVTPEPKPVEPSAAPAPPLPAAINVQSAPKPRADTRAVPQIKPVPSRAAPRDVPLPGPPLDLLGAQR